jgi:hypothetical protein
MHVSPGDVERIWSHLDVENASAGEPEPADAGIGETA